MILETFEQLLLQELEYKGATVVKTANDLFFGEEINATVPINIGEKIAYLKISSFIRNGLNMYEDGPQFCLNFVGYENIDGTVVLLNGANRAKDKNYLKISCLSFMTEVNLVCLIEDKFDAWITVVVKKNKSLQ
jgi:hypothetical protein